MTLVELPRREPPRVFVEAVPGLQRRLARALDALGELPDDIQLPGLPQLADALIGFLDALEPDADLEPEPEEEALPLFAFGARSA